MASFNKKILIVEDDNALRNILSSHLSRFHEIVQAADGEEGLRYILEYKPDLVLLDLMLPKLSGLDLLDQVRKHPEPGIANTKVIIFSNFSYNQDIMRAKTLNVYDYLVKANTGIDELVNKIEAALDAKPEKLK